MTLPERLPDGRIRVPKRAEADGVVGDGAVEVGPGDPDYDAWDAWLSRASTASK